MRKSMKQSAEHSFNDTREYRTKTKQDEPT